MNKKIKIEIAVGIIFLVAIIIGGAFWLANQRTFEPGGYVPQPVNKEPAKEVVPSQSENNTSMANPASVYCEQNGGKVEIVTAADGSQSGNCILPDGTKCEEWAYFRKECKSKNVQGQTDISTWVTVRGKFFDLKLPSDWGEMCLAGGCPLINLSQSNTDYPLTNFESSDKKQYFEIIGFFTKDNANPEGKELMQLAIDSVVLDPISGKPNPNLNYKKESLRIGNYNFEKINVYYNETEYHYFLSLKDKSVVEFLTNMNNVLLNTILSNITLH